MTSKPAKTYLICMTPKQQMFVKEYLKDLNGTQAAIRAGYAESGAHTEGHRLLMNAEVAEAIQAAKSKREAKMEITAEWVLNKLMEKATDSEKDADQIRATELLGKHLALFTENSNVSVNLPQEIVRKAVKADAGQPDD